MPVDEDFVAPGENWPRGYKTFFMLNSAEHEVSTAHNHWNRKPTNGLRAVRNPR